MTEYRCVHGHDRCNEMYPGPECPYCERNLTKKEIAAAKQQLSEAMAKAKKICDAASVRVTPEKSRKKAPKGPDSV